MRDAAERLQLQSGGGHDQVGVDPLAGRQHDAGGVDVVDVVGHHLGAAFADVLEQVSVEDQAHPLVPRVVARLEVHVDVVALGQRGDGAVPDQPPTELRGLSAGQKYDSTENAAFRARTTL